MSAVAFDTKLETPEGPFTAKTVLKTPTAVMTRTDDGLVRFAMSKLEEISEQREVLEITLENGRKVRVGPDQVLLAKGMQAVRAGGIAAGDELEHVFAFPVGYVYKNDGGEEVVSTGTIKVRSVEPGGSADTYTLSVERTGRFVFSAGILGQA